NDSSVRDRKPSSAPAAPAVYIDSIGRHEAAGIPAHEKDQLADLFRLAEAFHGHVLEKALQQLGRRLRRSLERSANGSGRNRQAGNSTIGELARAAQTHRHDS